jgi:hypothetical protein
LAEEEERDYLAHVRLHVLGRGGAVPRHRVHVERDEQAV